MGAGRVLIWYFVPMQVIISSHFSPPRAESAENRLEREEGARMSLQTPNVTRGGRGVGGGGGTGMLVVIGRSGNCSPDPTPGGSSYAAAAAAISPLPLQRPILPRPLPTPTRSLHSRSEQFVSVAKVNISSSVAGPMSVGKPTSSLPPTTPPFSVVV